MRKSRQKREKCIQKQQWFYSILILYVFPSSIRRSQAFVTFLFTQKDASFFRVTLRYTNQCLTMALFRRFHRMFRRRLCLLFVLVWIATVFLCGLEVMKFKTMLKKTGKDCKFTAFLFARKLHCTCLALLSQKWYLCYSNLKI